MHLCEGCQYTDCENCGTHWCQTHEQHECDENYDKPPKPPKEDESNITFSGDDNGSGAGTTGVGETQDVGTGTDPGTGSEGSENGSGTQEIGTGTGSGGPENGNGSQGTGNQEEKPVEVGTNDGGGNTPSTQEINTGNGSQGTGTETGNQGGNTVEVGTNNGTTTIPAGTTVPVTNETEDQPKIVVVPVNESGSGSSTGTVTYNSAGQTAGTLEDEEYDDRPDMSNVPVGLTLLGFGAGAASIMPQDYTQLKSEPQKVKGQDSYQKMNVFTK